MRTLLSVADQLESETDSDSIGQEKREKTRELAKLINDLRQNDCKLLLIWLEENREALGVFHGKQLEWKVKRLKFCQKLKNQDIKLPELIDLGKGCGFRYV